MGIERFCHHLCVVVVGICSEDGTEDTATQLAIAMQTFDSHNSEIDGKAQISAKERHEWKHS